VAIELVDAIQPNGSPLGRARIEAPIKSRTKSSTVENRRHVGSTDEGVGNRANVPELRLCLSLIFQ
jgi:hypothetical protein